MELKTAGLLFGKYFFLAGLIYLMGTLGFSFSWIMFGIGIWVIRESIQSHKRTIFSIRKQTVIDEKKEVLARLQDLPAWVFFPDVERAEWLNKMIRTLWPYVGGYVKDCIREKVEPVVRKTVNKMCNMDSFKFEKIELGDIPFKIGGIKVYSETYSRDEIIMDLDLFYSGDCYFQVSLANLKAGIKEIQFNGIMRVVMKPLTKKIPLVGALQVFFLNPPNIDFNLTEIANLFDFPGLGDMLRKIVTDIVCSMMVLPNKFPIKLMSDIHPKMFNLPEPKGVVRLHIIEASDLKKMDMGFLGKADPYAVVTVGAEQFRSKTIPNTLNPQWNYVCEAIVFDSRGPSVSVEVKDKDQSNEDDGMGRVTFNLDSVFEKGSDDYWLALDNTKSSPIHIQAHWFSVSHDLLQLQNYTSSETKSPDRSSCVLVVYIDSAKKLPNVQKSGGSEPSPFVECGVGSKKHLTDVCSATNNPVWERGFTFLISDPEMAELSLKIIDQKTENVLGRLSYQLKKLMAEKKLEVNAAFPLKDSAPDAHIQLYLQLLVMVAGKGTDYARPPSDISSEETQLSPNLESDTSPASVEFPVEDELVPLVSKPLEVANDDNVVRRRQTKQVEGAERSSINITMRHSKQKQALIVVVHKVVNLPCPNLADPPDPYVKLQLIPETKDGRRKTSTIKNNCNPIFDETFEFPMGWAELSKCSLQLSVCFKSSSGFFTKKKRFGKVIIALCEHELSSAITNWFDVESSDVDDEQA